MIGDVGEAREFSAGAAESDAFADVDVVDGDGLAAGWADVGDHCGHCSGARELREERGGRSVKHEDVSMKRGRQTRRTKFEDANQIRITKGETRNKAAPRARRFVLSFIPSYFVIHQPEEAKKLSSDPYHA